MKTLKAPTGKFLVVVFDPFDNEFDIVEGMEEVDEKTALEYAEKENKKRKSSLDCTYQVYDDTGFQVNDGGEFSP